MTEATVTRPKRERTDAERAERRRAVERVADLFKELYSPAIEELEKK